MGFMLVVGMLVDNVVVVIESIFQQCEYYCNVEMVIKVGVGKVSLVVIVGMIIIVIVFLLNIVGVKIDVIVFFEYVVIVICILLFVLLLIV